MRRVLIANLTVEWDLDYVKYDFTTVGKALDKALKSLDEMGEAMLSNIQMVDRYDEKKAKGK